MGRKKNRNQQSASKLAGVQPSSEPAASKADPAETQSEQESEDSWQVVTAAETKQSTSPVAKDSLPADAVPAPALSPAPSAAVSSSSSAASGASSVSSVPPSIAGESVLDSRSPSIEAAHPVADEPARQQVTSPVPMISSERSASVTSTGSTSNRPRKIDVTAHSKKKSMSNLQPAKGPQVAQMTINRKKRAQELFANTADMAKQLFDVLDADGDGLLTRSELCTSMAQIDPAFNDTPEKADMIFSVCDPTHKGFIDMDTFRTNFSFILNVQNAPAISLSASPTPSTMSALSAPAAGWTARHEPSPSPELAIPEPTVNVELTAEQQERIGQEIASLGLKGVDPGSFLLLKDKFDQFDSDKNGFMDKSEFAVMMRSHVLGEQAGLDAAPSAAEEKAINELWNTMDTDGDGRISFKEFLQSYSGATEAEPVPSSPTLRSPRTPTRGRPRGFSIQTLTPAQASALSKRSAAPVLVADASGSDSAPSTTRRLVPRGSQMTLKGVSTLALFNRNFSNSQSDLFAVPVSRAPLSQASPYVTKRPSMSFLHSKGYGTLPRDMLTRLTSQDSSSSLQPNSPRVVVSPVMSHRQGSETPALSLNDEPASTLPRPPKHSDDPKELFAWLDPEGSGSVTLKGLQLAMCHYIGRDLSAEELSEVHKILAKKGRRSTGALSTFVAEGEHMRSHTTASELEADRVNLEEFMHVLQHFKQSASEDRNIVKSFQAAYGGGSVELEEELSRALGELEELTNLNKDLTLAKNKATARYEEVRDHAERLETQNEALSKQVIELNTHKLRTQEKMDDLKKDLSKHEASVLRLTQQLEESTKALQQWKEQATHAQEELRFSDERMAQLNDKLKSAGDQITALEADREALKKMKQAEALRQQELDRLTEQERARLAELEETVTLLQEKDHEHTRMIADLQEHARQLEEERGRLRLALSTSLSNLEASPAPFGSPLSPTAAPTSPPLLADAHRGHQRKPSRSVPLAALTGVSSAQQKEASLQNQLGELSAAETADRLSSEITAARAQRDALAAEVAELTRTKHRAAEEKAKVDSLLAEEARLQAAVGELTAQHKKVEAELQQAAQQLEAAKQRLGQTASAQEAAAAAKQAQDRMAAELQQERTALSALRSELEQARAATTKSQAEHKTASADRDRLTRELEEEKKNSARLKSELDKLKSLPAPAPAADGPAPQRMVPTISVSAVSVSTPYSSVPASSPSEQRRGSVEMNDGYQSAATQGSGKTKLLTGGVDSSGHRRKNSMEFKEATCCSWFLSKPK